MSLTLRDNWFMDEHGRRVLLRGVNLGGSSKIPTVPDGATHLPAEFSHHRSVSFVGRPFPLAEADEHYHRLRHWGFNCLRFLVTWEALEHAGPGEYDEAFLDYLYQVVKKAGQYGLYVFIDPHQDVWSRMTGGDGAPGWTLEAAGFDITKLDASEAAFNMQHRHPNYAHKMVWPTNTRRLAGATLFTLFLAGDRFAPEFTIAGERAQQYLQRHFIKAMTTVAERLADLPHVIGYNTLNEPNAGYLGLPSLKAETPLFNEGPRFTFFEGMTIPAGFTRTVPYLKWHEDLVPEQSGTVTLNPEGACVWRDPAGDIWRQHGVWDVGPDGEPILLREDYFADVDLVKDCIIPLAYRYAEAIRAVDKEAIIFLEGKPASPEPLRWERDIPVVNASHWYDDLTMLTKHYDPEQSLDRRTGGKRFVSGAQATRELFVQQIGAHVANSRQNLNKAPTMIGEFGLPYDLDEGLAYRTQNFSAHIQALDSYYNALDANLVHCAQWNYTADNNNLWGDKWNREDCSIFSRDQQDDPDDPDSGGRAIPGFCRPRVWACAGIPAAQSFDLATGAFKLVIETEPVMGLPTIIYVPRLHYPAGFEAEVTDGKTTYSTETQLLSWQGESGGRQTLTLTRQ